MQRADNILLPVPEEVHLHIFEYLSLHELLQLTLINSGFKRLALDEQLWRSHYRANSPESFQVLQKYSGHSISYYALTKGARLFIQQSTTLNQTRKRKRDSHQSALKKMLPISKRSRSESEAEKSTDEGAELIVEQLRNFKLLYTLLLAGNLVELEKFVAQLKMIDNDYIDRLIHFSYIHHSHYRHFSLMHVATEAGHLDMVSVLAKECSAELIIRLFTHNKYHDSVFHVALRNKHFNIVEFFLGNEKFNLAVQALTCSPEQDNPLFMAIDLNDDSLISYLVNTLKISVNHSFNVRRPKTETNGILYFSAGGTEQMPALLYAASRGKLEAFNILIGLGADLTLKDTLGNTALHHAVHSKNSTLLRQLEGITELETPNHNGITPIQLATSLGFTYTKLFENPNLTDEHYQIIFWQDWKLSKSKPERLRDIVALLRYKNIFNNMPNGLLALKNLIAEIGIKVRITDNHVLQYRNILQLLNDFLIGMQTSNLLNTPGIGIFSPNLNNPSESADHAHDTDYDPRLGNFRL